MCGGGGVTGEVSLSCRIILYCANGKIKEAIVLVWKPMFTVVSGCDLLLVVTHCTWTLAPFKSLLCSLV